MFRWMPLVFALAVQPAMALELTSTDVTDGAPLAGKFYYPRCGGQNISPQLAWSGIPAEAKSLVLTMIDVSVPPRGWSHWIVLDLPPLDGSLPQGVKTLPQGAHGLASAFGDAVYDGPCPPQGTGVHRYQITVWAMPEAHTTTTDGSAAIGPWLEEHAIAKARITGTATPPPK